MPLFMVTLACIGGGWPDETRFLPAADESAALEPGCGEVRGLRAGQWARVAAAPVVMIRESRRKRGERGPAGWCEIGVRSWDGRDVAAISHPMAGADWFVHPYQPHGPGPVRHMPRERYTSRSAALARCEELATAGHPSAPEPETAVMWRRWRTGDREAIAVFPYRSEGPGRVLSYERVGQHGAASWPGILARTVPAGWADSDVAELVRELSRIGYRLKPVRRANASRVAAARAEADRASPPARGLGWPIAVSD